MAEEETSQTQSMMLWQFAPPVSTAVQQQPILIAPFMAPPPLISISSTPTIQSLQQQLYQQLLPQVSVVGVQQESTQAPRPGVISPPVGKKESAESEKPIHMSVVSPVNKDSSHQWSESSSSTSSSKQSSKTAERRRGSVIMGVGSSTHTKKSSVTTIVDKSDHKQEVTSSGDVTGSRRTSGGTVKMATLVGAGSSSGMNNLGVLNTTAAMVWSPPETHITSSGGESSSIIVQEVTPKLAAKTPPIHTRFPSLEPKVDLRKRRGKKPADIDAFVIPLKKGWRRETMIRSHTKADVCYTTPCGRRLRAYQEVTRYLELNHITDLTVDNFSFSTKIMVGQFLESREDGSSWRVLSDDEIASKNLTVDKRLLGCKKRKVSLDNIPNTVAGVNSVIMNNTDPSEHTQANSTHSDQVLMDTPHSNEAQAKATADLMPTSGHTPNHDHTHISTPASSEGMRCADISETLGPHTTIVTISPADVDEPVTNSNTVSTVYVDGPSTDDCPLASVTMPTIASPPPPTKQPDSSSSVAKGMVVYPRKRGRKRKEEGGNSMPIHLPRKRGNSTSKPEAPLAKRRGRPPKVINQSMQSMTSHFETHQPNVKKVSPSNQSTMPVSSGHHGHHVPMMAGVSHSGRDHRSGKGTRSGSHHQPEYTYRAKKKLGRPRKEEVELRRKEEIRLKAEKIRRRAEKYAQSKAVKKLMKEEKLEAERQRQLVANHLAKQREQEDLQYRRSRIMLFQEQEQRRKQKDLSQNLIERNKQYIVDDKMRMEQQSLEFEIQYQLKKPIEDLELKRVLSLPTLTHIPTACLTSTAFAQVQVIYEFIAAFSEFLGFEEVPSFPVLCGSLHNVNRETFLDVFVHLLKPLLNDYGGKATVATGENLSDVELTTFTASELFRVLTNMSDEEPSDKIKVIISKLESESVSGLRPSDKAALLNYMVDTLLSSNSLVREIDSRMEMMSNLRREKWKVNLKLKKFRTVFNTEHTTAEEVAVLMKPPPYKGRGRPPKRPQILRDNVEEDSSEEDEGQDGEEGEDPAISEEAGEVSAEESDEDLPRSKDHLEGRIKQLKRKQAHIRVLLNRISTKMRSFPVGNDRYTRSYWHLPALGGLYVEGADSFPSTLNFWGPIEQDVVEEDPPIVQEDTKPHDSPTVKKELDEEDTVSGAVQSETEDKASVKCEKDPVRDLDIDKEPAPMTVSIHLSDTPVSYTVPTTSSAKDTSPNKSTAHPHPTTSTNDMPMTSSTKIGSVDTTVRPAPAKHTPTEHPLPPALVTGQGGSTDPAARVASPPGSLSPTSTSVMMTIHSPTGVGMVTGTMEVTPVSSAGVRSSVITSASLSGDEGAQKNKTREEATVLSSLDKSKENTIVSSSQRSDVWFSIFPRESCSKPCDMEKLIARCTAPPGEPSTGTLENKESTQQLLPQVPAANSETTPDGEQGNSVMPMSQYSYMYVQTPEGDTQLCLVENSVMPYLQTVTLQMEVPPAVVLENEGEMSPYATPITVEAGRWQTFHHNFQQMMATLEKKQFRTPSELLATVANDKKSGWWFLEKGPNVDLLLKKLSSRGYREKHLCKTLSKMKTLLTAPSEDNGPQKLKEISHSVMKYYAENGDVAMDTSEDQPDQGDLSDLLLVARDDLFPEENRVQAMLVMKELKGIEERLFAANLERKGSAHPCSGLEEQLKEMSDSGNMLSVIGRSLLKLQEIVDKQYMNEPFSEASSNMDTSTANETEQQASPLDLWKIAITTATSASQLAVCMAQLDKSIAWEKSLLKVFCTHCHKADDEANLLLCDGCDRGTHTYCCKPKLANVPDGDWFCANCVSTTSISRECTVCLGRRGPFTHCTICPRVYHKKCLSSAVPSKLKGDHSRCPSCIKSASPTMHTRSRGKGRTSSPSGLRASTNSPSRGRDYAGSPRTRAH